MKLLVKLGLLMFCLALSSGVRAQDTSTDAEGCKDSPLITRMPGSYIEACDHKEFDQFTAIVGVSKDQAPVERALEGDISTWTYNTRQGTTLLQVFRNIETAAKTAGFAIDYADSPRDLTEHKGNTWLILNNRDAYYNQTIVVVKAMEQEITMDASALSDELNKSGHVAVYGINFETGKSAIQPDSEGVLGEIVKLMEQNADLKLSVEGHTDNVGTAASNQVLSEKRAQAVVAWLTAHGVESARLSAKGWGQTKPIADNSTDDGRAKNRRVELVKL